MDWKEEYEFETLVKRLVSVERDIEHQKHLAALGSVLFNMDYFFSLVRARKSYEGRLKTLCVENITFNILQS
jgi:hypothetical protein